MASMSSAWQIHPSPPKSWRETKALENLYLNPSIPKPTSIPPKSALVRIRAAAINARDVMVIAHDPIYPLANIPGLSPCADGAGEITAVGESSDWKVGERVIIFSFDAEKTSGEELPDLVGMEGKGAGAVQGTLREWGVFKDADLVRAPSKLSFEEIGSMGAAGGTAVNALFFGPKPVTVGMTVLTQGTGGVSCFAIQLAAAAGAIVISTSSSDEKLKLAKQWGATHTINYATKPDWEKEVLRLTGGKGVDHVVEVAGSSTIEQSLESTKRGGLISLVGFLTDSKPVDLIPSTIFGGKILRGVFGFTKEHDEFLVKMVEKHGIRPVIGKVFEWKDAIKAFEVSMERSEVGKIVIKV